MSILEEAALRHTMETSQTKEMYQVLRILLDSKPMPGKGVALEHELSPRPRLVQFGGNDPGARFREGPVEGRALTSYPFPSFQSLFDQRFLRAV